MTVTPDSSSQTDNLPNDHAIQQTNDQDNDQTIDPTTYFNLLQGKLVRLTGQRAEDKEAIVRWTHDAEFFRYLDDDPFYPRGLLLIEDEEKELQLNREGTTYEFRIRTVTTDHLIGFIALWVKWNNRGAWIGLGIGEPEYRSKGYGSEALQLAVDYCFRELNLHRVQLGVYAYNKRAIRAYEKVGFRLEGTQRECVMRDGRRYDAHYMGLLYREWQALRANQPKP